MAASDDLQRDLLERWRQGERAALDQLLTDVMPWLHREVSLALGNQPRGNQDSMDLAQTAVLNFLRRGARFVPQSPTQFRALLKRIATNELIDHWRRRRLVGDRHLGSLAPSANPLSGFAAPDRTTQLPGRQAERSEDSEWVKLALQFLGEQDRWLLLASEVEGMDWAAIARELGIASADSARMRAARLKPKLANLLRKLRAGEMPPGD